LSNKKRKDGIITEDTEPEVNEDFTKKETKQKEVEQEPVVEEKKKAIQIRTDYLGKFVPQMADILDEGNFKQQLERKLTRKTDLISVAHLVSNIHILQTLRDILKVLKEEGK